MPEDVFTDWGAYLLPTNKDHFQHYYWGVPPLPISLGQLPHRTTNPLRFRHAIPFRTTTIILFAHLPSAHPPTTSYRSYHSYCYGNLRTRNKRKRRIWKKIDLNDRSWPALPPSLPGTEGSYPSSFSSGAVDEGRSQKGYRIVLRYVYGWFHIGLLKSELMILR